MREENAPVSPLSEGRTTRYTPNEREIVKGERSTYALPPTELLWRAFVTLGALAGSVALVVEVLR